LILCIFMVELFGTFATQQKIIIYKRFHFF
jgi:hypothetical protein